LISEIASAINEPADIFTPASTPFDVVNNQTYAYILIQPSNIKNSLSADQIIQEIKKQAADPNSNLRKSSFSSNITSAAVICKDGTDGCGPTSTTLPQGSSSSGSSDSTAIGIGVGVGVGVVVILAIAGIAFSIRRRRQRESLKAKASGIVSVHSQESNRVTVHV